MKTYLVVFCALVFSYSLSAQIGGVSPGVYSYKTSDGLYNINVSSNSKDGIVVVDLERVVDEHSNSKTDKEFKKPSTEFKNSDGILHIAKGLITDRDTGRPLLEFKNDDGTLTLKKLKNERQFKNKKGYLRFKSKKSTSSYKYVKGNLSLPGWDEGVAAVLIII